MKQLFTIEKKEALTQKDGLYLRNLYQPLVGIKATMLYHLFIDYYYLNKIYKTFFNLSDLALTLNLSISDLNLEKQKLEAVGLIRTFVNKNDCKHFLITLNRPLNIEQFIKNSILSNLLINKIGDKIFKRIAFAFKKPTVDKALFDEVSAKFQDIFVDNQLETVKNTLELSFPVVDSKISAIKTLPPAQFATFLTKKYVLNSFLKLINEIQQLGFSSDAINLIVDYSFEVNGKIIYNHIRKIACNFASKQSFGFNQIQAGLSNAKKNKLKLKDLDHFSNESNQTINWFHQEEHLQKNDFNSQNFKPILNVPNNKVTDDEWQFFLNNLGEN